MRAFRKASTQTPTKIHFSPLKNTCPKLILKLFDTWKLVVLKCKIKLPWSIVSATTKKSIFKYAVTHIVGNATTHTWNQTESLPHWFVDPNHVCHLRGFPWFCSTFLQVLDSNRSGILKTQKNSQLTWWRRLVEDDWKFHCNSENLALSIQHQRTMPVVLKAI